MAKRTLKKRRMLRVKQAKVQKTAPLGGGARFAALKASIAARPGVREPGAVAAFIGRKKFGKAKFQAMAAAGRRKAITKRPRRTM